MSTSMMRRLARIEERSVGRLQVFVVTEAEASKRREERSDVGDSGQQIIFVVTGVPREWHESEITN